MVIVYRVNLAVALGALIAALLLVANNLATLSPEMGNGGAFLAALSMGVVLVALAVATPLAWLGAAISYVWQEAMPEGVLYHYSVPLIVALPGTSLLLAAAWLSI